MNIKYYSINGAVKFSLSGDEKFANSYRYVNYLTGRMEESELDFIINFRRYEPDLEDCQILDDKYYVKKDYFYCADRYKIVNWEIEISNIEKRDPLRVNIDIHSGPLFNTMIPYGIVCGLIIDPIIYSVFCSKGYVPVHASCASKDGKAYVFIGRSGAGKTSIVLSMIKNGFRYISDDITIFCPDKKVFGFIKPLNIFSYNLNDDLYGSMTIAEKLGMKCKYLAYRLSGGYVKIFTNVNPFHVFRDRIEKNETDIRSVFLLIPKKGLKDPEISTLSRESVVKHSCFNQALEMRYFDRYISTYSYAFPGNPLREKVGRYGENFRRDLKESVSSYRIYVPEKFDSRIFNDILCMVNEHGSD